MEIVEKIKEIVEKVQKDPALAEKFSKDPAKSLEGLLDVDLPDEMVNKIIEGVKAQVAGGDLLGKIEGGLAGLFGKGKQE